MPEGGPYPPYWGLAGSLPPKKNASASSTIGLLGFISSPNYVSSGFMDLPAAITVGTAK